MNLDAERRILQFIVSVLVLLPLYVGLKSVFGGPEWLGHPPVIPADLDSHFRYLSGIFVALGVAFATCVPHIEWRTSRFRLLGLMVFAGGLGRLIAYFSAGEPSRGHMIGLGIELVVVPLLMIWQMSLASRWRRLRMPVV